MPSQQAAGYLITHIAAMELHVMLQSTHQVDFTEINVLTRAVGYFNCNTLMITLQTYNFGSKIKT